MATATIDRSNPSDPSIAKLMAQPGPQLIDDADLNYALLTTYQRINITRVEMDWEWTYYLPFARELAEHYDPHRWYEYMVYEDRDKQEAAAAKILSGVPADAIDANVAGMFSAVAPPSQQWFEFGLGNPVLEKNFQCANWLTDETNDVQAAIGGSNFYPNFPLFLRDMITNIGGCFFIEEDAKEVFKIIPMRPGQYRIGLDKDGRGTVFIRTYRLTVRQLIQEFGHRIDGKLDISNFSQNVISKLQAGLYDHWIDVIHYAGPNSEHDPKMLAAKYNLWKEVYMELGVPPSGDVQQPEKFLRESGRDYFPVIFCPAESNGKDAYATVSPGKNALPDVKELYFLEQQYMLLLDLQTNPPVKKHPDIEDVDAQPGGETDVPEGAAGDFAIEKLFNVDIDLNHLAARIEKKEDMVQKHFKADFFRMLLDDDSKQPPTATEIMEKKKEIMVLLGPAFGQITKYCLEPFINIVFHIFKKQGRLRPAPAVLQNLVVQTRFVSVVAKALKIGEFSTLQAWQQYLTALKEIFPNVTAAVDEYEMLQEGRDTLGLKNKLVKPEQAYQQALQAIAKQAQAAQTAQAAPQMAQAAQNLSQADPQGGLLGRLMAMNNSGSGVSA